MKISKLYIKKLKNRIFKILPLFEEKNEGIATYIDSIIYEVYGLQYVVEEEVKPLIISILSILKHFHDDSLKSDVNIRQIKREVFHCLDLIEKYYGDDVNELLWAIY